MMQWEDLVVVTTGGMVANEVGWKSGPSIFPAETCNRHIYIGRKSDFKDAEALLGHRKTQAYYGEEAHRFFVEFFNGLHSHYHSDTDTAGQTTRAWNAFKAKSDSQSKELEPFISALFADGAMIKTAILNPFLSRPTVVNTAVRMAGIKPSDRVLVIGGAEVLTLQAITALGYKKRDTPDVVTLTHPDRSTLDGLSKQVKDFDQKRKLRAELNTVLFDRALNEGDVTTVFNAQAVFVCHTMTSPAGSAEARINERLVEAWQLRRLCDPDHTAKIIHLTGDPEQQRTTTGEWVSLRGDQGFIEYPTVKSAHEARVDLVRSVVGKAKEAIAHLAKMRVAGERVKTISFSVNDGMTLGYVLATRPRGHGQDPGVKEDRRLVG